MQELLMTMLIQGLLGSINWTAIVALAGGAMLAWKLIRDATRPRLVVALLALAVIGGGWWFWAKKAGKHAGPQEAPQAATVPTYRPALPWRRPVTPRPYARTLTPKKPYGYAGKHAEGIRALAEDRDIKVMNDPSYLDPVIREQRHQMRLAKEAERKRKAALVAQAEAWKAVKPDITAGTVRFDAWDARIARAQAELRESIRRQQLRMGGGMERTWR